MIKTIIFDNNGVLTTSETKETFLNMANFLGVNKSELRPIWKEAGKSLDTGHKTSMQFYNEIVDHFGLNKNIQEMEKAYKECYLPNKETQNFAKQLKKKYKTVLLSNFGDKFYDFASFWKLDKLFLPEEMFISFKLNMRKPDERMYRYVLSIIGNEPEETIFIDDSLENVEASEEIGINGIVFKTLADLKQELKKYITI